MSYTVESVNDCTKKFIFRFETVDLSTEIKNALLEKQKNANLKGYRKGKAPLNILKQLYGQQVENDALYQFISTQFFEAIRTEGVRAVSMPQFSNTKYNAGKEVSFDATVEVFPQIEVNGLDKIKLKKEKIEITEEELENNRKNYLGSKAEMKELTDEQALLAKGHFAVINFQGEKEDGQKPENMKGQEYLLEVGSNYFIPGFEEEILGMKKDEKKTITVTFPADYHEADLQNAPVKFHVELLEIKEKILPEFTDELAKEFGYESVKDFEDKNKAALTYQKERAQVQKLQQEILDQLIELNLFEAPPSLVQNQKKSLVDDMKTRFKQQGLPEKDVNDYLTKWNDDLDKKAVFQVRSGLILNKLANEYKIEVTETDLSEKYSEMATHSGMSVDEVKNYYSSKEDLKQNLKYAIREEKTFQKILNNVK